MTKLLLIPEPTPNTANELFGCEKELKYVTKIVTKTHVAFIDLEDRKDGKGVLGENGGASVISMKKIKSIRFKNRKQYNGYNWRFKHIFI